MFIRLLYTGQRGVNCRSDSVCYSVATVIRGGSDDNGFESVSADAALAILRSRGTGVGGIAPHPQAMALGARDWGNGHGRFPFE